MFVISQKESICKYFIKAFRFRKVHSVGLTRCREGFNCKKKDTSLAAEAVCWKHKRLGPKRKT